VRTQQLVYKRLLRLKVSNMHGTDVGDWQEFCGLPPTQRFGDDTDVSTRRIQRMLGVVVDGKVGRITIDAANRVLVKRLNNSVEVKEAPDDVPTRRESEPPVKNPVVKTVSTIPPPKELVSSFKQAKNYKWANRKPADVTRIVLHTAEIAENSESAEALASWVSGPDAPKASWHFAVDNTITQSVYVRHVAFAAPGANRNGIQIEMCGRARQSPEDWADEYSVAMLAKCAKLVASLCVEWDIPVEFLDEDVLLTDSDGITTHQCVTLAFKRSTHTDPGPHFPLTEFLDTVRRYVASDDS